jgi:hypothetical protein
VTGKFGAVVNRISATLEALNECGARLRLQMPWSGERWPMAKPGFVVVPVIVPPSANVSNAENETSGVLDAQSVNVVTWTNQVPWSVRLDESR